MENNHYWAAHGTLLPAERLPVVMLAERARQKSWNLILLQRARGSVGTIYIFILLCREKRKEERVIQRMPRRDVSRTPCPDVSFTVTTARVVLGPACPALLVTELLC